jgi:3,4-dihydroxy-2-butanone 4-phosphate synthase
MQAIASEGCGLLIYEQQEGRGIGLMAKLQAYGLQDRGLDTVKADHVLGLHSDYRDFALPIAILRDLGISGVRLLSNNPQKSHLLRDAGVEVVDHISCEAAPNPHSVAYLRAKKEKLGHTLTASVHSTKEPVSYSSTNRLCSRDERKDASASDRSVFASVEGAIRELRVGRMIVVVDDESRENEGDLMIAAEMVTPEAINFMTTYRRGLICLAMTGIRLDELELPLMVSNSTSLMDTSFTISIDAKGRGVTTGISANDRAETVLAAIDPQSRPHDFSRPGHIFPLKSREGGVLERRGHTEAAVDLARLAGLNPAAVI